jgi:hypothetical protein
MFPVAGISPGTHDIELKWKVNTSTVTMYSGQTSLLVHPAWTIIFANF